MNSFEPIYTSFEPVDLQTVSNFRQEHKHIYSSSDFNLERMKELIQGIEMPVSQRITLMTGEGGMKIFQEALKNKFGELVE